MFLMSVPFIIFLSVISLVAADVNFIIDSEKNVHPISSYIYGINTTDESDYKEHNVCLTRLGGNRWTAYNWENNASNAGIDWFNQNDNYLCMDLPTPADCYIPGGAVRYHVETAHNAGASVLVTVPIQGYVASDKDGGGDVNQTPGYLNTRFHVSKANKGGALSLLPDTTDSMVYQDEFVNWLESTFPYANADPNRTIFYSLDNEPDLWASTHPRIQPEPIAYEALLSKSITFASAIKDVAPQSLIFGPVSYGWYGYVALQGAPDAGGRDFLDFYLSSMKDEDDRTGRRLLDVLDLHWYPEARGGGVRITSPTNNDPPVVEARIQAPRSLWDPTYVEDSWIITSLGGEAIHLIPRMYNKVETHYPDTKLAFTEYYYGGGNHISGGIAQADVLGIFGREGVFAATLWRMGTDDSFIYGGIDMYRNYDGAGSTFGDTNISASTDDIEHTSVYASVDAGDPDRTVLVAINKTAAWLNVDIQVIHPREFGYAEVYQLTSSSATPQQRPNITTITGNAFLYTMPPLSVSTLVLDGVSLHPLNPTPDIKANGSDEPLTISQGELLTIAVSLDPGDLSGADADWWVAAHTPFDPPLDWYTYVYPEGWRYGIHVCAQTPLYELTPSFNVLNTVLPAGNYIFYFAVDGNMDGEPDATWLDSIEVHVK